MVSTRPVIFFIFFPLFALVSQGQEKSVPQDAATYLSERLAVYAAAHPSSNLYLHLDKTVYSPEETVWFKAYLLADTSLEAKVLYVRILDEERNVVAGSQFPMYDIRSHGSIELSKPDKSRVLGTQFIYDPPRTLVDGNYILYAYTDRMVSLNDTNIFAQPISIRRAKGRRLEAELTVMDTAELKKGGEVRVKAMVRTGGSSLEGVRGHYQLLVGGKELDYGRLKTSAFGEAFIGFAYPDLGADDEPVLLKVLFAREDDYAELSLNLPRRGSPLTVSIHPEGGTVTAGGRVSVEVHDIHDRPVAARLLVKRGGKAVDSVRTDGQGIAVWEVPLDPGVRYTLATADGRGERVLEVPPLGDAGGYGLTLYNDSSGCRAVVRNNGPSGERDSALLVLRSPDKVVWSRSVSVAGGGSASVDVPADEFSKGVWGLALFDHENTLLAERLFLNKTEEDYKVSVHADQEAYGTKKKVTVRLRATDAAGNPTVANLSVSATETVRLDSTAFRSILGGRYYGAFAPAFRQRLSSAGPGGIDGLLLGGHWAHNRWEDVLAGTDTRRPERIPRTNGTTGIASRRIKEVELYAVKKLGSTDSKFEPVVEHRTIEVDRKTRTFFVPDSLLLASKGQEWQMEVPRKQYSPWEPLYLVEWQDPDIGYDSAVVRGGELRMPEAPSGFSVANNPPLSAFDFQGVNLLQEVVIGRRKKPVRNRLRMTNCELYEEMIYTSVFNLGFNRSVGDLEKGKIHPWGWYYPDGEKTVLYLGCGRYRDINYIRNITVPEEFPLPDYEHYPSLVEDIRSTVYWNPNIVTDTDGTATFSFFTSETTGGFTIVVQGLTANTLAPLMGKGEFKVEYNE